MKILIHWLISAIAIIISAYFLKGVHVDGFMTALIIAIVLGAINGFIRPILVFLTLPITIVTLGLFLLVLNTLLIMLVAAIIPSFTLDGFWWALIFGIVLTFVNTILQSIFKSKI
ncbi:phage holin family protein [Candidatus Parcubacteria bacterium]|nr:MAG: phage holin family protein [Candidatus Parcubacteria bacterium]